LESAAFDTITVSDSDQVVVRPVRETGFVTTGKLCNFLLY